MIRGLMSDVEWAFFEPFVVASGPLSGRPPSDHRGTLDGIFWVTRAEWSPQTPAYVFLTATVVFPLTMFAARWAGLYDVLGGNPLAAMPSLHFATSLMAAHLLGEA